MNKKIYNKPGDIYGGIILFALIGGYFIYRVGFNIDILLYYFFPITVVSWFYLNFLINNFEFSSKKLVVYNRFKFYRKRLEISKEEISSLYFQSTDKGFWGHPILHVKTKLGISNKYHALYISHKDFKEMSKDMESLGFIIKTNF